MPDRHDPKLGAMEQVQQGQVPEPVGIFDVAKRGWHGESPCYQLLRKSAEIGAVLFKTYRNFRAGRQRIRIDRRTQGPVGRATHKSWP